MFLTITFLLVIFCGSVQPKDVNEITKEKNCLFENELKRMLGSDIVLSDNEEKANEIIMDLKYHELEDGFINPHRFNVSKHFFEYKESVRQSPLFQIIKDMPKGAVLHAHDTGLLSPDYVLNLTYWDNLYVCFEDDDVSFLFSENVPDVLCMTQWQLTRDARFSSGNVEKFDAQLRKHFTIVISNPAEVYTDINKVWHKLQNYFIKTGPLFCYKPVWRQYFYDTLKTFRDDNIMYLEFRSVLPPLYDLDGTVYDSVDTAVTYNEVLQQFLIDYPDFFGAKLIYAPLRLVDPSTVEEYLQIARTIKEKLPNFFAGFDLVGQEDLGVPTKKFLPQLAAAAEEFDFFFHAGETNWYGSSSDENLFDVILLGAKRIGHAFALYKHPTLIEEVRKREIALEVNVISNAVLKLIDDVRNHPLAFFLAEGLPVVISCDDPGVWEADPLSHDFYVTFVGVASRHADIKLLKKLALNSIYYSTASDKDKILHEFEIRWTKFIDNLLKHTWQSYDKTLT